MSLIHEIYLVLKSIEEPFSPNCIITEISKLRNQSQLRLNEKSRVRSFLYTESKKPNGMIIRISHGKYDRRVRVENRLKNKILNQIRSQGLLLDEDYSIIKPNLENKEAIRNFHKSACADKYNANSRFLAEKENELINFFADGTEIDVEALKPKLQVVESGTIESDLFRYATLLWSVPVSNGFGRRVRYLLWDQNKVLSHKP